MADPTNVFAMDDIKFMTGYNVEPVVASEIALEDAIERYYGSTRSLELQGTRRPGAAAATGCPAGGGSLKDVLDGPGLSVDDMASSGGLAEIDLDAMGDADADVETVKAEEDEIDLGNLTQVRGRRARHQALEPDPDRLAEARAPRTSTSSPTRRSSASASASTASSTTSWSCR